MTTPVRARRSPSTGDPRTDRLVPAALAFVQAVHDQDMGAALDATAAAEKAADGHPHWQWLWTITLAALVPVDARLSHLLAWVHEDKP